MEEFSNKFEKYRARVGSGVSPAASQNGPPQRGRKFLRGPIPWTWLSAAGRLPGRAFQVGIVIWFLVGVTKKSTVVLSGARLRELGVKRNAGYRALKWLEQAGLVQVLRHAGRQPRVTVLEAPAPTLDQGGENGAP